MRILRLTLALFVACVSQADAINWSGISWQIRDNTVLESFKFTKG